MTYVIGLQQFGINAIICDTRDPTPSYRPLREYSTLHSWKGLAIGFALSKQAQ